MKKTILLTLAALAVSALGLQAQDRTKLRINEVMVTNESSIVDEYGQHSAWIELFNANFAPLDISSVYLTTDKANPKMYPVPLGDEKTHMGKRQHVVFFADGKHDLGTFHTSFTLEPGKENTIYVFDANGVTLIDSVTVPANLPANASWARVQDGAEQWGVRAGATENDYITPSSANEIIGANPRIQEFAEKDENGFAMTIMAMCIVFSALLVLCLCFYGIGAINKAISRHNKAKAKGVDVKEVAISEATDSGEVIAAITMALHEHLNVHDIESTILTIKKMKRAYSPWSSKIYSLRELPRR